MFPVPIIILGIVFALIAVRRIGNIKLHFSNSIVISLFQSSVGSNHTSLLLFTL